MVSASRAGRGAGRSGESSQAEVGAASASAGCGRVIGAHRRAPPLVEEGAPAPVSKPVSGQAVCRAHRRADAPPQPTTARGRRTASTSTAAGTMAAATTYSESRVPTSLPTNPSSGGPARNAPYPIVETTETRRPRVAGRRPRRSCRPGSRARRPAPRSRCRPRPATGLLLTMTVSRPTNAAAADASSTGTRPKRSSSDRADQPAGRHRGHEQGETGDAHPVPGVVAVDQGQGEPVVGRALGERERQHHRADGQRAWLQPGRPFVGGQPPPRRAPGRRRNARTATSAATSVATPTTHEVQRQRDARAWPPARRSRPRRSSRSSSRRGTAAAPCGPGGARPRRPRRSWRRPRPPYRTRSSTRPAAHDRLRLEAARRRARRWPGPGWTARRRRAPRRPRRSARSAGRSSAGPAASRPRSTSSSRPSAPLERSSRSRRSGTRENRVAKLSPLRMKTAADRVAGEDDRPRLDRALGHRCWAALGGAASSQAWKPISDLLAHRRARRHRRWRCSGSRRGRGRARAARPRRARAGRRT